MYVLRLFHRDSPFQQIDALSLGNGNLTIGRDAGAGLVISDPTSEISRLHCVLAVRGDSLALQDLSTNGVFVGASRERVRPRQMVPIQARETIHIGQFVMVVEPTSSGSADVQQANMRPNPLRPPIMGADAVAIPPDWTTVGGSAANSDVAKVRNAGVNPLFDAFCEGARLDPCEFDGEDQAALMARLGAIYQQMVLGLGVLMSEKSVAKGAYGLDATSTGAQSKNPFKWAPTKSAAVDLLHEPMDGCLGGAEAVKGSFVDLRKHLVCMTAGSRAVLSAVLQHLSPERIEQRSDAKPLRRNRDAALWRSYGEIYNDVRRRALGDPESPVNLAFREAYEHQLRDLNELSMLTSDAVDVCGSTRNP